MPKLLLLAAAVTGMYAAPNVDISLDDPDYTFRRELSAGQTLSIGNIDGSVTITRTSGRTAEVLVTKRVIRGNGDRVQAILVERSNGIKVCTVYHVEPGEDRENCNSNSNNRRDRNEPLEVEMTYEVRVPDGVVLNVATVDGDVTSDGVNAEVTLTTVDGNISVSGRAPSRVSTVDGDIDLVVDGRLPEEMRLSTVDGTIKLALPAGAGFNVRATTVDGHMESDFPTTVSGKWGPKMMRGSAGDGSADLRISTVDGSVEIRSR